MAYAVLAMLAAAFLILAAGCSGLAGPAYERPQAPEKAEWVRDQVSISPEEAVVPDWWTRFQDPYLDQLISQAIAGNLDIRILAARVELARAGIGQARAGALPTVSAGAGIDRFKSTGQPGTTQYSLAAEASWELDIWGKIRKGVDAQQAEYRASQADWRAGYLTLVSDVANSYFQIRQFDELIAQQEQALATNRRILAIQRARYREGLIPKTQVLQQQAEIDRRENELIEFRRQRTLAENALATLLGRPAGSVRVPPAQLRETVHLVKVPAGLPSDLLTRRPDIVAAEYRVLQAHNLVGQARLARLPSLSLTGRAGTASFALTDLTRAWTFGLSPTLTIPIFDPNIKARIKVSEAQARITEEEYRRTVVGAFEDVENALTNLAHRREQKQELEARREKLRVVADQVRAQLREGMVSQLELFESERSLLEAEQQLLVNHWQILSDTVALYKALGGGWPRDVVQESEAAGR